MHLLFIQCSFRSSNFILFITPASIHTVFFSSLQLLFIQCSLYPSSYFIYIAFVSFIQLLFIQYSFHSSSFSFSRRIVVDKWCTTSGVTVGAATDFRQLLLDSRVHGDCSHRGL